MSPELLVFVARVLERALEKSGHMPPRPVDVSAPQEPDDPLLDALASQLLGFINRIESPKVLPDPADPRFEPRFERVSAKNQLLARAVGACECWGELVGCPRCGGMGAPGWQVPDRAHFDVLVRPALRRVSALRTGSRNGSRNHLYP
ncbi:MAG: hypothetical protein ABR543_03710 [Gemmatimonadaceae bacterium]